MKKVWVVCGADKGIGPALVKYLLFRHQIVVAISALTKEAITHWSQQEQRPADIRFIDVSKAHETESAVQQIMNTYGRIDRLINIGDAGLLSLYVYAAMQQAGQGHIIQFTDKQKQGGPAMTNDTGKAHTLYPNTGGINYTLIDPDLFFQTTLTNTFKNQ